MFNFGQSIRKWISLFFSIREAYILLGGELTKKILLEQGVPQGDVVSPYIFIMAVEILLIKINHTKNIKGIIYAKKESQSETFADDTSIFIQRNPEYFKQCVNILKHFSNISGLQCNQYKTSVVPIGGNFDTSDTGGSKIHASGYGGGWYLISGLGHKISFQTKSTIESLLKVKVARTRT